MVIGLKIPLSLYLYNSLSFPSPLTEEGLGEGSPDEVKRVTVFHKLPPGSSLHSPPNRTICM